MLLTIFFFILSFILSKLDEWLRIIELWLGDQYISTNHGNYMFTYSGHSKIVYSPNIILTQDKCNMIMIIIELNNPIEK